MAEVKFMLNNFKSKICTQPSQQLSSEETISLQQEMEELSLQNRSLLKKIEDLGIEKASLLTAIKLLNNIQSDSAKLNGQPLHNSKPYDGFTEVRPRKGKKTQDQIGATSSKRNGSTVNEKPSVFILGDSITKNLIGSKMSSRFKVTVRSFSGTGVKDMSD